MPRRRKKKTVRIIYPSAGPLPLRLAARYAGVLLVFSDASAKRHGGLAAVLFDTAESEAVISTQTVPIVGSNELELQAALFALTQAEQHFPGRPLALFSDNQDAVIRLTRTQEKGSTQDPELSQMLSERGIALLLDHATIYWIKGHSSCRGNMLADLHAAEAAS